MKFLDEYRNPVAAREIARQLAAVTTRPWTLMEVCGGQTHAIVRFGVDELLPAGIRLLHGPGCPVCVTPLELIDRALATAAQPGVIFASFGDMLRVPGSTGDLLGARAAGADVRIVLSPLDAVALARSNPASQVVFFGVGFETTAPATALALAQADQMGLDNFSILVSHVLVPPALETILASPENQVQAFLAAGHVCTVMGTSEYEPIARAHRVPIVVTGFEPLDILQGVLMAVTQLEEGRAEVENQYARAVHPNGNTHARRLLEEVFEVVPRKWRGIGTIAASGLALRGRFRRFDAEARFGLSAIETKEPEECISGLVLQGVKRPNECPAFGTTCTPERPLGATMVSSEGACAAYFRYRRPIQLEPR
ncbi:MAG: hydrogenase formation protein HypD [bacterium]